MHDDVDMLALDVTDFEEDRRLVGADDRGESVAEVPDPDGVSVSVEDLLFVESVLPRGCGDDRITRASKAICGGGSRNAPR